MQKSFPAMESRLFYEFWITDTGIGMQKEFVKNKLFQPFTQEQADARTQYKGSGLGMSIVKGLIESMNGSIQVESVPGEGTTFTFRFLFFSMIRLAAIGRGRRRKRLMQPE